MDIRIVSYKGKHSLYFVKLEEAGYVEKLYDEVTFPVGDYHEMAKIIDAISEAKKHSVIMVTAGNKRELFVEED